MSRDENTLFRQPINNDKNSCIAEGWRKLFDEVHRDRVPRTSQYRKLLQESVRLVTSRLRPFANSARIAVVFDESPHLGPNIFLADKFQGLVLTKVPCNRMIVFVL